jgi:hypothetical protein
MLGGLLNRLRGGLFGEIMAAIYQATGWKAARWLSQQRTQIMRSIWAVPTGALMAWQAGTPWWMAAILAVSSFAGVAMFGNGQYLQDVPLSVSPDWLGLARNSLASVPVVAFNPVMFALYASSGMVHAALYWLGFRIAGNSQAGEVIVGAVSWAIIINS